MRLARAGIKEPKDEHPCQCTLIRTSWTN